MNINLIRLQNASSDNKEMTDKGSEEFLNKINTKQKIVFTKNDNNALFNLVFIETGGVENAFLKIYKKLPTPIYLLASGESNSLAAALEIISFLKQRNISARIIEGEYKYIEEDLLNLCAVHKAKKKLRKDNLGIIGESSDWLIASHVNFRQVFDTFGISMIKIPMKELIKEIEKKEYVEEPRFKILREKKFNKESLEGALHIYGALKRLIMKYELAGLTVRCFDLLGPIKNTACLAFALLNEQNVTATCEGDVPSLLTMHIVKRVTGKSSFQCNPARLDRKNNTLTLAHCTVPLDMCESYALNTHYESNLGVGIKGELELGKCTIIKLAHDFKTIFLSKGTIKENLSEKMLCRTQIVVELENNKVKELLNTSLGNHLVVVYGDQSAPLKDFFNYIWFR